MNANVIIHLLLWYGLMLVSGLIFWLSFHQLFNKLSDKGYALSRALSLILPAIILWTLGFVFKLPITNITVWITMLLFWGSCLFYKYKFKIPFPKVKKSHIIAIEAIFFIFLVITLFVTSFHPAIDDITERIMDFQLLDVLTTTSSLPAKDMWSTSDNVNYYYFGYFFFGIINKLTGTDAYMGYLFAMGFIYAMASGILFSLAYSFKKNYYVAIFAVLMPLFFSNFNFIYKIGDKLISYIPQSERLIFFFLCIYIILFVGIFIGLTLVKRRSAKIFLILSIPAILIHASFSKVLDIIPTIYNFFTVSEAGRSALWFPDVSRVIENTINEFPFYSIVIGDLHPHYLDLFFLPAFLTLLYLDFRLITPKKTYQYLLEAKNNFELDYKKEKNISKKRLFLTKLKFLQSFKNYTKSHISNLFNSITKLQLSNKFKFLNKLNKKVNLLSAYNILICRVNSFWKVKGIRKIFFIKLISLLAFSAGIATNSWELICFAVFIFMKDVIFIIRTTSISYHKSILNVKKLLSISAFLLLFDMVMFISAFLLQIPFIKSITVPVSGIRLNLINNNQDFLSFFKDNFTPIGFIQNINNKLFVNFSPEVVIASIVLFIAIGGFIYNFISKETKSTKFQLMGMYAGFLISLITFILVFGNPIFSINNFGVEDIIFTLIYAFVVLFAVYSHLKEKLSPGIYVAFITSFSLFSFTISTFTSLIILFVQKNFDLSPFGQYLNTFSVYLVIASVGIAFIIYDIIKKKTKSTQYFILSLLLSGIFLAIFTEFFYVADFFGRAGYEHHRANTIFKINYIGFVFFGLAAAWVFYRILKLHIWQRNHKENFINYTASIGISLFRSVLFITVFLIFLYVPYTLSQWFPFFENKFLIADKICILIIMSVVYIMFILFGIALFIKYRIYNLKSLKKRKWNVITYCITIILLFSLIAVVNFNDNIFGTKLANGQWSDIKIKTLTLDGYAATKSKYPKIFEAIEYFMSIKDNNDVILQVNGDAYKHQSIASVYSVTPTILGWWGHEAQWRESSIVYDKDEIYSSPADWLKAKGSAYAEKNKYEYEVDLKLGCRVDDIKRVYTLTESSPSKRCGLDLNNPLSNSVNSAYEYGWKDVVKKYKLTYIWVSQVEKDKIGPEVWSIFENNSCFLKKFDNNDIRLYKILCK